MIYLGQFSFEDEDTGNNSHYGFFNCLVEADNMDKAIDMFSSFLKKTKKKEDLFDGTKVIFLDEVIEIKKLPKGGLITNYTSFPGYMPSMLHCPIFKKSAGVQCYGWVPDDQIPDSDSNEAEEVHPFIKF